MAVPAAPTPVDEYGIVVASLPPAAAVLVTPAHQYPTGVALSPDRRRDLLRWANRVDGIVIEDDYDAEYRYDRQPVRALQGLDPARVAYTSSLSKTLAPGLRLGWLVPPETWRDELIELRWATDLGSSVVPQLVVAELLRNGAWNGTCGARGSATGSAATRRSALSADNCRSWPPVESPPDCISCSTCPTGPTMLRLKRGPANLGCWSSR